MRGWCAGLWMIAGATCANEAPTHPNIVLILLDTVRADHLGTYGYERSTSPNIDALAQEGVLFENVVSQAPWTAASVASLFTGLYPSVHGLDEGPRWSSKPTVEGELPFRTQKTLAGGYVTLAETLKRSGYSTVGFVSNLYLNSIFGLDQGFDHYDDEHGDYSNDVAGAKRRGAETNARLFPRLERSIPEPFFLLVHYNDPHWPYNPPAPYGEEFTKDYRGEIRPETTGLFLDRTGLPVSNIDAEDLRYVIGLYDGELQYTDALVGLLLDKLSSLDLARPLITALTADHGEEFLDHGSASHGYTLFEESIRVPLILHAPGELEPLRISDQVRTIDLMPTILDLAGVDSPEIVQGHSLLPLIRGEREGPRYAFSEATYGHGARGMLQSVRVRDDRKLIVSKPAQEGRGLFFDLKLDPGEQANRFPSSEAQELLEALATWRQSNLEVRAVLERADTATEEVVLDEEALRRLKALGYID